MDVRAPLVLRRTSTARISAACPGRRRSSSTAVATTGPTTSRRSRQPSVQRARELSSGVAETRQLTVTRTLAVTTPEVAVIVAAPSLSGLYVVDVPSSFENFPMVADHCGQIATALPYASKPDALNGYVIPRRSVSVRAEMAIVASVAGVTVSTCCAVVRPGAEALTADVPATVSR